MISIKTTRIKEKIARLKQEMSRPDVLDAQMRNTPDQQISLTDPDAVRWPPADAYPLCRVPYDPCSRSVVL